MSQLSVHTDDIALGIATIILQGFNRHFAIFQKITSGARERFEKAD